MKKLFLILIFINIVCTRGVAQGIRFTSDTWQKISEQAAKSNKPIFIDFYTTWCAPCRKLDAEVFSKKEVGDFFNENFICCKIDAEKGEGITLARKYGVNVYPTGCFIAPSGRSVTTFTGLQTTKSILDYAQKAVDRYMRLPELESLELEYKKGNRQKEFLINYCNTRTAFGEKGGMPVVALLQQLTDEELTDKAYTIWIKSLDINNESLLERLVKRTESYKSEADKKAFTTFNGAVMRALSNQIDAVMAQPNDNRFNQLMSFKRQLTAIEPSNDDNGITASMGGGTAYIAEPQIRLSYYKNTNNHKAFEQLFLHYINEQMKAHPIDSLLHASNVDAIEYNKKMNSDSLTAAEKKDFSFGYGMMKLLTDVKAKLLAGSLFNAAEYYVSLHQPTTHALYLEYAKWLRFIYAVSRKADIVVGVLNKLHDLGFKSEAQDIYQDYVKYLKLTGDKDNELPIVDKAMQKFTQP